MMLVSLPSLQKTQPAPTFKVKVSRHPPMIEFQNKKSLKAKYKLLRLRQVRDPLRSKKMKIKLQVLLAATTTLFQQRCNMSASKVSRRKKKWNLSSNLKLWQNLCLRHNKIIRGRTSPPFHRQFRNCKKILISGILSYWRTLHPRKRSLTNWINKCQHKFRIAVGALLSNWRKDLKMMHPKNRSK